MQFDIEMVKQKINAYEHLVNHSNPYHNIYVFERMKEELFQELIKIFKAIEIK